MRTLHRHERTAPASGGLHLDDALRAGDHRTDLVAALASMPGTLDGLLACIQVSAHGARVAYRPADGRAS